MQDELFQQLLRKADARNALPDIESEVLIGQVRRLHRSRRRLRLVAATTGSALALAAGLVAIFGDGSGVTVRSPVAGAPVANVAEMQQQVAAADAELRIALKFVALLEQDRELAAARQLAAEEDPAFEVRMRIDEIAYQMLCRADELRVAEEPAAKVAAAYQNVIELFPYTSSAEQARERLAAAQPTGENPCDRM